MALAVTLCALEMVSVPKRVPPPTAPTKLILPVPAAKLRLKAPLTVLLKVISPGPVPVFRATLFVKLTADPKLMLLLVVVMLAPKSTVPAPDCVNGPLRLKLDPEGIVSRPLLVIVTPPPPVVVTAPSTLITLPDNTMPAPPLVFNAPLNVIVPGTPLILIEVAVIALVVTLFALVMVNAPKRVVPPAIPLRVISSQRPHWTRRPIFQRTPWMRFRPSSMKSSPPLSRCT